MEIFLLKIFIARVIERIVLTLVFIGIVIILIIKYRNDTSRKETDIEVHSFKLKTSITLPIVLVIIFLGYTSVSLQNPIDVNLPQKVDNDQRPVTPISVISARGFDESGISRTFGDMYQLSGISPENINNVQRVLKLSIEIEKLNTSGQAYKDKIGEILKDNGKNFVQKFEEIDKMYHELN